MIQFTGDKAAFGRHETFPLRYSWLTKGFQALKEDPKVFESEDATVRLGVGKNMVNAIRYWLQAAKIIKRVEGGFEATPVGLAILDDGGYDPYLEDEATIWLVHWMLATNPELATAWYWFFNRFHKPEFTSQEVATALVDFTKNEVKARSSATTVKNDAAILLRMYVRSKGSTRTTIEEALDSPLSMLNLISGVPGSKTFQSRSSSREGLPLGIFAYALGEVFQELGVSEIPIEELMYGKPGYPALGAVFRMTESALLTKLERLVHEFPETFEIRETAGIHQMYLIGENEVSKYLENYYVAQSQEAAA